MICDAITIAGIEIPCNAPIFLTVLAVHIPFGLASVVTGLAAILSRKAFGHHPAFGTIYYWCLAIVFVTATILAAIRWAEAYPFFILGALSVVAASVGRTAHRRRWPGWIKPHIGGMGLSYVFMLTAFYVDNGKSLPLWKDLPPITYWLLPSVVGLPLIVRALLRHPLVRVPKKSAHDVACLTAIQ